MKNPKDFIEVFFSSEEKDVVCQLCWGYGQVPSEIYEGQEIDCPWCGGRGTITPSPPTPCTRIK